MTSEMARTPLYQWHVDHQGRMVNFAGWLMPVQYTSITEEHLATRQHVTLFDVSHMGRFRFVGADAVPFLNSMLTRRIDTLAEERIRYSFVTNESGGILDDVLVYHMPSEQSTPPYLQMVVNASNRAKLFNWFQNHIAASSLDVDLQDDTLTTAMIAVQGPSALFVAQKLTTVLLESMKYFSVQTAQFANVPAIISRTGYTGEDGIELIVAADQAINVWEQLMREGESEQIAPAGLGARDTLRLEAGMPLYGHELSEEINPAWVGMPFAIDVDDHEFPGRSAVVEAMASPKTPCRIGLRLRDRRVPREDCPVLEPAGRQIGRVTSGTFSPTLQVPIAMAYVPREFAEPGTELMVDIRGRSHQAIVTELPFYKRK